MNSIAGESDPAPLHHEGDAAVITLSATANRNALTPELLGAAISAVALAEKSGARVIVLAHAGPALSSGMDLGETDPARLREALELLVQLLTALAASPLPVIARVEGAVRAGGIGLLGVADFAVAADDVTFAFTETRFALAPAVVSAVLLPRLANRDAVRLFLTAESIDATEAARVGIITHAVPRDQVEATVRHLVEVLAAAHPQGMKHTRALVSRPVLESLERNGDALVEASLALFLSPEARSLIEAARRR